MSINSIGGNSTPTDQRSGATQGVERNEPRADGKQQPTAAGESNDTVQISSQAVDLQALEKQINDLPDVDSTRVSELRDQIANGEFEIDGARVADKILSFESQL